MTSPTGVSESRWWRKLTALVEGMRSPCGAYSLTRPNIPPSAVYPDEGLLRPGGILMMNCNWSSLIR